MIVVSLWDAMGIIPAYAGSTRARRCTGPVRGDHPRIRGEHSPRHEKKLIPLVIIPAYAGSTPGFSLGGSWRGDHPRIRGEHVGGGSEGSGFRGSSPHTRGARSAGVSGAFDRRIIPAYAGSTDAHVGSDATYPDHPRIRGEHLWRMREEKQEGGIIPAYAGSTAGPPHQTAPFPDHPRIRGEHTSPPRAPAARPGSSPHTRGARRRRMPPVWRGGIIPAYAGSTRGHRRRRPQGRDHPRIRGEHRPRMSMPFSSLGSSPHTRGAPARRGRSHQRGRIIPAYAGSTIPQSFPFHRMADHPRIRGEHSLAGQDEQEFGGSSPHTRGARVVLAVFRGNLVDHPRIRGEHPAGRPLHVSIAGSSPHTRGALVCEARFVAVAGIIPGYAGSTDSKECPSSMIRDHPRIRGEHCDSAPSSARRAGSSPHTRGARSRRPRDAGCSRIIPAYAGSTIRAKAYDPNRRDHPRIRGEHEERGVDDQRAVGSSPHTRGAPGEGPAERDEGGIIPAYAGSTATSAPAGGRGQDHPRIRGEHGAGVLGLFLREGSSPHTRGALQLVDFRVIGTGIIPAYAGSTQPRTRGRSNRKDHPRIRGEHRGDHDEVRQIDGSSPHTRGAPGDVRAADCTLGSSPHTRGALE